jgi:hypothetical protein
MEKPKSTFEYLKSPCYQKERDGKLSEYLRERCFSGGTFSLFKGMKDFNMLKNYNLFRIGITSIRVMWNIGRGDEHYMIVENNGEIMLEGITGTGSHDGNPGLHKPEDILEKRKDGGVKKGETMTFELHYPNLETIKELEKRGE